MILKIRLMNGFNPYPKIFSNQLPLIVEKNSLIGKQRNLETLRSVGYQEIEPRESLLACGDFGKGALADIQTIIEQVMLTLNERNA
ncbi:hypothetical protein EfmAA610_07480 [Enterococcus faecium]|nr:hypothetical protein EfmAA610_07480 [Enterococcus faecium]